MAGTILIVEDDTGLSRSLTRYLTGAGYDVVAAADGETGLARWNAHAVDLALVDLKLPGIGGLAVLKEIKMREPTFPVVIMTACADIGPAVEAIKAGAYDYLKKPFDVEEVAHLVANALRTSYLQRELSRLEAGESRRYRYLAAESALMREVFGLVDRVSRTPHTPALIVGETGTGKEIIAREIHARGARAAEKFVTVNCSAFAENLLESELFGHVRGAFTDARKDKRGLFEYAGGGTLFLDEIGDMKLSLQPKILRALEERSIRRVGGVDDIPVDVRVVAATNRDLPRLVHDGLFREDLFYRLNVFTITVPPLRDRPQDVIPLAEYFIAVFNAEFKKQITGLTADAKRALADYRWPGNVRELRNIMERAVILNEGREIPASPALFPAPAASSQPGDDDLSLTTAARRHVLSVFKKAGGNRARAAAWLGISRTNLWAKLKEYGAV